MQFGLNLPNTGIGSDVHLLISLAQLAETSGWDGFFVWDTIHYPADEDAACDPWIALAAIATLTRRMRLGTLVTPLSRRRPWKVAREAVTLDHLSQGRFVLGVGLGDVEDAGISQVGEVIDAKMRAQLLDEGLAVVQGLWSGKPFTFTGTHFQIDNLTFTPPPVQHPRIPIWVGGYWPRKAPMRRAAQWDGVFPGKINDDGSLGWLTLEDIHHLQAFIAAHRTSSDPFDIVMVGESLRNHDEQTRQFHHAYAEAGVTWWIETVGPLDAGVEAHSVVGLLWVHQTDNGAVPCSTGAVLLRVIPMPVPYYRPVIIESGEQPIVWPLAVAFQTGL